MLDPVFYTILIGSTVISLWRGLISELISLLALIVGVALVVNYNQSFSEWFVNSGFISEKSTSTIIASAMLLVGVMLVGALIKWLLQSILEKAQIFLPLDKLIGALFGFGRGVVIICAFLYILNIVPDLQNVEVMKNSELLPYFQKILNFALKYFNIPQITFEQLAS